MKTEISTETKTANNDKAGVSKSFIVVSSNNEYWEGEKYIAECADYMGVLGFEKENAMRMTEEEANEICERYKSEGLTAINVC